LAVLCVLLPLAGHVLVQCHTPPWIIVVALAAVAVPSAFALTRRRVSDAQLLGALAVSQVAYHVVYSLPGACAQMAGADGGTGGFAGLIEHSAVSDPPPGVTVAGHLVALALAARLLGLSEQLLWHSTPSLAAMRRLLSFLWPLLRSEDGCGPRPGFAEGTTPLRPVELVWLNAGRAPPYVERLRSVLSRPLLLAAPCSP
jgi:hypothetical protein